MPCAVASLVRMRESLAIFFSNAHTFCFTMCEQLARILAARLRDGLCAVGVDLWRTVYFWHLRSGSTGEWILCARANINLIKFHDNNSQVIYYQFMMIFFLCRFSSLCFEFFTEGVGNEGVVNWNVRWERENVYLFICNKKKIKTSSHAK